MSAQEKIKKERQEGKTVLEQITAQKGRFSAGKAYNSNIVHIGETVFTVIIGNDTDNTETAARENMRQR